MACHLAPGGVAFGTLALYSGYCLFRQRRLAHLGLLGSTLLASVVTYFGSDVRIMTTYAASDGWLPVGAISILLVWPAILAAGCIRLGHSLFSRIGAELEPVEKIEHVLVAGLLAAGLFQGYLTCKMVQGTCALYAVKSLFFFTFPLATLLWAVWSTRLTDIRRWFAGDWWTTAVRLRFVTLAAILSVTALGIRLKKMDPGLRWRARHPAGLDTHPVALQPQYLPHQAAEALCQLADKYRGYYYFDPYQPFGSYYATLAGLQMERSQAAAYFEKCKRSKLENLRTMPGLAGVLVPRSVDPAALAATPLQVEETGPFWICWFKEHERLASLKSANHGR
jgi:hypothetical protein